MIKSFSRRNFLGIAGLYPFASALARNKDVVDEITGVFNNKEWNGNLIAELLETKIICVEPGRFPVSASTLNKDGHPVQTGTRLEPNRYLGWPTVVNTRDNVLIVAYSGDRDSHVCPFGKTQLITSFDNGKSWRAPRTITNTPLDDRDAGIIQTKNGTILVSWFTSLAFESPVWKGAYNKYARIGEKIAAATKQEWLGNWTKRSLDNGKTWLPASKTIGTAPHGPVNLKNGNLLYVGTGKYKEMGPVIVEKSTDDGQSWEVIGQIPLPVKASAVAEPHVIELPSGKLLALIRNESKEFFPGYLLQSESKDGGLTWSEAKATNIWGYPPHLIVLKNKCVLATYGYRKALFSQRACVSYDEGETWDLKNEIILTAAVNGDMGYPSSAVLSDGSILSVYYQSPANGQPTNIMSTHWKLKNF